MCEQQYLLCQGNLTFKMEFGELAKRITLHEPAVERFKLINRRVSYLSSVLNSRIRERVNHSQQTAKTA